MCIELVIAKPTTIIVMDFGPNRGVLSYLACLFSPDCHQYFVCKIAWIGGVSVWKGIFCSVRILCFNFYEGMV